MSLLSSFGISASGLSAERLRMDITANNLANANTAVSENGEPFRRELTILEPISNGGVRVSAVVPDASPFRQEYNPGHPMADQTTGMVMMPNINPVNEMVDLISATRAYEANIAAFNAAKTMIQKSLDIGR